MCTDGLFGNREQCVHLQGFHSARLSDAHSRLRAGPGSFCSSLLTTLPASATAPCPTTVFALPLLLRLFLEILGDFQLTDLYHPSHWPLSRFVSAYST